MRGFLSPGKTWDGMEGVFQHVLSGVAGLVVWYRMQERGLRLVNILVREREGDVMCRAGRYARLSWYMDWSFRHVPEEFGW